ncbi:MAG: VOC family protein [Ilumatobacteraceae bacterium]
MGHGVGEPRRSELAAARESIAERHLRARADRPASTARGVHHLALISSDVERTVEFYDGLLGFPLIEMFENRDYEGSTHFFFDIGEGNTLAFFDLPGVDVGPYAEVLGGHHHLAISMTRDQWLAARARLDAAGIEYAHVDGSSLYFRGPDGERLELISDPLREMYGKPVG